MVGRKKRIAIYAGAFDPPAWHHHQLAERLTQQFDEVIILPTGPRADRPDAESVPIHRAVMADLNFRNLPRVRVELGDLERNCFTQNCDFAKLFGGSDIELSHVVPVSAVAGGRHGQSKIQTEWGGGQEIWNNTHFTVLIESDEPLDPQDLPPNHATLAVTSRSTTAFIRTLLYEGGDTEGLIHPEVAAYIRRHGLFRPTPPSRESVYHMATPRLRLFFDSRNAEATKIAEHLKKYESSEPELIVAIGGDGTMLRAIRQHWRERLPFYGLNTGHIGFLLNNLDSLIFWQRDLRLYQLPLLWVELLGANGERREALAFNDCWVERETGQTAWTEVMVNGQIRMPRVVSDGMLVSTAAGSTSYARAMGATPLPFNAPLLTLAGSNVLKPEFWHPAVLPISSTVQIKNLDPQKRPLQGFVDGVDFGRVLEMTVRVSNIAAVELLFTDAHDPVAKLAVLQFPQPT